MKRLFAVLGMLVMGAGMPSVALAAATQIAVTGTGTVTLMPDEATINGSITTVDPNAETATSRNNALYEKAVAAVTSRGIARSDVTLSYYNVNYQPKPDVIAPGTSASQYGYTVTRSFAVKVHAIAKAGAIVDALTPTAGIEINGVTFGLADPSPARRTATAKAVADAREKAQAVAAAAGLHLTAIQRIELEGAYAPGPIPMVRMNAEVAAPKVPTTFDTGNVNVTVNVNVVYSAVP